MIGFVTAIIACVLFGFLGQYVAKQKNRSGGEGFLLGFCLALVGVFIILLLPTKEKVKQEYTPLGAGIGLLAGIIIGSVTDNVGLGIALGLCFGAGIGSTLEKKTK